MKTKKFAQIWFYLLILVFAAFATTVLYLLRYQPLLQFVVVTLFSVFYFVTGVLFHLVRGDLKKEVVLEFGGVAVLIILSFAMLTYWRLI